MALPVIMVIDDDQAVLNAVERDIRAKFGKSHRVVKAQSGEAALEVARQLLQRNEIVALFLTDQRMPRMTGIQFLEQAREIFPDSKKVLLTAYADTEVAIASINDLKLDYYLMKPWDPPEENLYPVMEDLLEDWRGLGAHAFRGLPRRGHAVVAQVTRSQGLPGPASDCLSVAGRRKGRQGPRHGRGAADGRTPASRGLFPGWRRP